jgi:hypothetical protein
MEIKNKLKFDLSVKNKEIIEAYPELQNGNVIIVGRGDVKEGKDGVNYIPLLLAQKIYLTSNSSSVGLMFRGWDGSRVLRHIENATEEKAKDLPDGTILEDFNIKLERSLTPNSFRSKHEPITNPETGEVKHYYEDTSLHLGPVIHDEIPDLPKISFQI